MKMRQVPIAFTDQQYTYLKQRSKKTGSSIASIIRDALFEKFGGDISGLD